jgi:hypothetical protein
MGVFGGLGILVIALVKKFGLVVLVHGAEGSTHVRRGMLTRKQEMKKPLMAWGVLTVVAARFGAALLK